MNDQRALTFSDLPFVEQIAEMEHPLSGLLAQCGGFNSAARRRWALAHIAARTADPATFNAILGECDGKPEDNDVLTAALRNPAVPLSIVRDLIGCRYFIVCEIAAADPRLPAAEVDRLAAHQHPGVRRGVCLNPSTPRAVLERLTGDSNELVSSAAGGALRVRDIRDALMLDGRDGRDAHATAVAVVSRQALDEYKAWVAAGGMDSVLRDAMREDGAA